MAELVQNVGFQPFLALGIDRGAETPAYAICYTQQEIAAFCTHLMRQIGLDDDRFRLGFFAALSTETYDAMEHWYAWIVQAKPEDVGSNVRIRLYGEGAAPWSFYSGYPLFEIDAAARTPQSPRARAEAIAAIVEGFSDTSGNDLYRWFLIEAGALALSKYYGGLRKYADAEFYVDLGLAARPYSMHLKAAKFALEQMRAGQPAPPRLSKFIGPDDGYLKNYTCEQPWIRFDVGPTGEAQVCCGHWIDRSIGNVVNDPADQVLNSPAAIAIRQSMLDGTYKYCNHLDCMEMINHQLPKIEDARTSLPFIKKAVEENDFVVESVRNMLFALDQTCNLTCPSCRTEKIVENPSQNTTKLKAIDEHIVPVLKGLEFLNINPAGEVFASKTSRRLLEYIGTEHAPGALVDIISNGTLFNEKEWERYPNIHGRVRSVRISTDAATKETFEKLRRLGRWEVFLANIKFLGGLRVSGAFGDHPSRQGPLRFSFTYQMANFREMADFVRLVRSVNGTSAVFERLQNLGAYSDEEFRRLAVHHPGNPHHQEFLQMLKDPILRGDDVYADFGEFLPGEDWTRRSMTLDDAASTSFVGA